MIIRMRCASLLIGGLLLTQPAAWAQQTIFNVPSADVTPQGQVFLQHESQFRPWAPDAFWLGTHYGAVGIGHHTELDATLLNVSAPASDNVALGLGFKSAIPLLARQLPDTELKWTVGELMPISLQGQGVGIWAYSHLSGRLPKLKTRLTAGASYGSEQIFGRDVVCMIAGVEQPLTRRLALIGDWYSGTHANAFLITGLSVVLHETSTLYLGFQIPNNAASGRSGFVIELAKFF